MMKYLTPLISAADTYTLNAATQTLSNKTLTSPVFNELYSGNAIANGRVTSDIVIAKSSSATVTGLSFSIGASEVWTGEIYLFTASNSSGFAFQMTGPASSTNLCIHIFGTSTAIANTSDSLTAFSTLSTQSFCATTAASTWVRFFFVINNGVNSGTITLQANNVSSSATATILKNSYMTARRIV